MKICRYEGRSNISGERVRRIRRENGISQEKLAIKLQLAGLNITQKTISRMETGKRIITDYELSFLADVLNVTVYDLLGIQERAEQMDL